MDWVMSLMNVAGSPSPVGLMMLPYPKKLKVGKSNENHIILKFSNFQNKIHFKSDRLNNFTIIILI